MSAWPVTRADLRQERGVIGQSNATLGDRASTSLGAPPSLTQLIMPTSAEISRARERAQRKALLIGAMALTAYWGVVIADGGPSLRVSCAAVLVVAVVATATSVTHDSNHGALACSARFNRLLGYSADLIGASSWLWRYKHSHLHHGNTKVVGADSDISQAPFARLAPEQPWRPWHRYKYLYLWFLCGFVAIKWLTFADFSNPSIGASASSPGGDDPDLERVPMFRWIMGGLDLQIEHHLAPRLPHTIYPLVVSRLQALCTERGISHRLHPNLHAGEPSWPSAPGWSVANAAESLDAGEDHTTPLYRLPSDLQAFNDPSAARTECRTRSPL
jgi:fatty acid desaturase